MRKMIGLGMALLMALSAPAAEQRNSLYDQLAGNQGNTVSLYDQITGEETQSESEEPEGEVAPAVSVKETVMVYMCGSSLENANAFPRGARAYASQDLGEMAASGFNPEEVNVLVFTGGAEKWYIEEVKDGTTGLYQLKPDALLPVSGSWSGLNMGDPATLLSFLTFGYEYFPAERYSLILWDHGGGSIGGICVDELYQDSISMEELSEALLESPFGERKLSWIGFDACLMSAAEVAGVVAPFAEFMIGSEETEPGYGWSYRFLKGLEDDESPMQTGQRIIDDYFAFYEEIEYPNIENLSLALIDLSKYEEVKAAVNDSFASLTISAENFPDISRARRQTRGFGRQEDRNADYDLVDLGHLVRVLSETGKMEGAQILLDEIQEAVPYRSPDREEETGLSVYFPFYNKALFKYAFEEYKNLDFAPDYVNYISEFGTYLVANSTTNESTWGSLLTQLNNEQRDTRILLQLSLTEEEAANFGMAEILALQMGEENTWRLVATQEAELLENGSIAGEYVHTNLFVVDEEGNPLYLEPIYYDVLEGDRYVLELGLWNAQQGQMDEAQLICKRDSLTNELEVLEVYLYDEAMGMYFPRQSVSLENYDEAVYRVTYRVMPEAAGEFGTWEVAKELEYRFSLREGNKLAFVKDAVPLKGLYGVFGITDVFNNYYVSSPVPLWHDIPGPDGNSLLAMYDDDYMTLEEINISESGRLTARLTNGTEEEIFARITDVVVDGEDAGLTVTAEVSGSGDYDGLLPGEANSLSLTLPLKEGVTGDEVLEVSFNVQLILAETEEEWEVVPVTIWRSK